MEKYTITEKFLDSIIDKSSRCLCGLVMKRFEIFKEKNAIKASIKELIYENYRSLKEIIKSFSSGVRFISKKPEK